MPIEIKNRFSGSIIFSRKAKSLKIAVEMAVKDDANLRDANLGDANLRGANLRVAYLGDANLRGADLRGADLRGADLGGAYLGGADLGDANLRGANLRGADLGGANLGDANLGGVKTPPINDHYFASEILFRASKTENQKNFAARIRIETDKCWKDFFVLAKKMKVVSWAKKTLKWKEYQERIKGVEN